MAPSNSPQKLFPSHRTEAPHLRSARRPQKYRSMADIMARAAPAVIDGSVDDNNSITCNVQCDREDAYIPGVAGQPADTPAVICSADGDDNATCHRCGFGDREDAHIPDAAGQRADTPAGIGGADDDDNATCHQCGFGDREDAHIPDAAGQRADTPAGIGGADDDDNNTYDRCSFGEREDAHIPDATGQRADTSAVIGCSDDYDSITCHRCGLGDREDELLLCDKCDRGYHMDCVRPVLARIPNGSWFCSYCTVHPRPENFTQKEMEGFFRIQKSKKAESSHSSSSSASHESRKRRRRSTHWERRSKRRLLPYVPSKDEERRYAQMQSLAIALVSKRMDFSNELTYRRKMAPRSANRAELEIGGIQVFSKEDTKTVEKCLTMMKNGEFPPLLVVYDPVMGYTVHADDNIKSMTFLLEHTGDVDYIKNRERDDCDSLMTLLLTHDYSQNLLICQDKRGNIGRFLSGINNHTPEGKRKKNVKAVRYNVDGVFRVFLVAIRNITKGERLYYDYNGYEKTYPTQHFV